MAYIDGDQRFYCRGGVWWGRGRKTLSRGLGQHRGQWEVRREWGMTWDWCAARRFWLTVFFVLEADGLLYWVDDAEEGLERFTIFWKVD